MNINLLKGHIRACAMSQAEVADKLGISLSRFNAKINARDEAEFTLSEVCNLKKILDLSSKQVDEIFFR